MTVSEAILKELPGVLIYADEPMSAHTSFKIGGMADAVACPKSESELCALLQAAERLGIPSLVIGNGTNLLVSDGGVRGLVIKTGTIDYIRLSGENGITAGCGALLSRLAVFAMKNGLSGLEFAHGIPGTVGGAVVMNAGAYGGEISHVVTSSDYISAGVAGTLDGPEHLFGYRRSFYTENPGSVALNAVFSLRPGGPAEIRALMNGLSERRRNSQPLEYPSAGSFFKRPPGNFAGTLIEMCGLKGASCGGARVSEKHAGFIVNTGGATCEDVRRLAETVRETVLARTGVELTPEARYI